MEKLSTISLQQDDGNYIDYSLEDPTVNGKIQDIINGVTPVKKVADNATKGGSEIATTESTVKNALTANNLNASATIGGKEIATTGYVKNFLPVRTGRDFSSGTLIKTSINYSYDTGDPFFLEIKGNSYGFEYPVFTTAQGYLFNRKIINFGVEHFGIPVKKMVAEVIAGNLCFWFPFQGYFQGFDIACYNVANGNNRANLVTEVLNIEDPKGDIYTNLYEHTRELATTDGTVAKAKIADTLIREATMDGKEVADFYTREIGANSNLNTYRGEYYYNKNFYIPYGVMDTIKNTPFSSGVNDGAYFTCLKMPSSSTFQIIMCQIKESIEIYIRAIAADGGTWINWQKIAYTGTKALQTYNQGITKEI